MQQKNKLDTITFTWKTPNAKGKTMGPSPVQTSTINNNELHLPFVE